MAIESVTPGRGEGSTIPGEFTTRLRIRDLLTGSWFPRVVAIYVHYRSRISPLDARPPARARGVDAALSRASLQSAIAGAATATVTSGTEWLATQGPLAAMAAVPIGALAVGTEMIGRTLLDLRLVCDLAEWAGVPFDPKAPGDLARLCALVRGADGGRRRRRRRSLGRDVVERLVEEDESETWRGAGARLLGEGVAKNLFPVVNVITSAAASWHRTRQLGDAAWKYVRYRRAGESLRSAARSDAELRDALIEAAWVMFTADGPLEPEETSVLVHALRRIDRTARGALAARFVEDPSAFLARLGQLPERSRSAVWHSLQMLAAADGRVSPADRRVLQAAAQALGEVVRPEHLSDLVDELQRPAAATAMPGDAPAVAPSRGAARRRKHGRRANGSAGTRSTHPHAPQW